MSSREANGEGDADAGEAGVISAEKEDANGGGGAADNDACDEEKTSHSAGGAKNITNDECSSDLHGDDGLGKTLQGSEKVVVFAERKVTMKMLEKTEAVTMQQQKGPFGKSRENSVRAVTALHDSNTSSGKIKGFMSEELG
eukprot:jgi/Phyca11/16661/fgenesh1_pg.PHYCAscaffold_21_\